MGKKYRWLIPLILIVILAGAYLYPTLQKDFGDLYSKVDTKTVDALVTFREMHPVRTLELHGIEWNYASLGDGPETILFLHGMTGAYDIWWQ